MDIPFSAYGKVVFDTMEYYCSRHLESKQTVLYLEEEYNWLDDIYAPIYDTMQAMVNAQTTEDLIMAIQWASHLDHANGVLMRDHSLDRYYDEFRQYGGNVWTKLNQMEQDGLETAFPNWQTEVEEILGIFSIRELSILPPDEWRKAIRLAECSICGETQDEFADECEDEVICETCAEILGSDNVCIECEKRIGHYGQLCFGCALDNFTGELC